MSRRDEHNPEPRLTRDPSLCMIDANRQARVVEMVECILSWKERCVVRSFCPSLSLYRFQDVLGTAIRERSPICLDKCRKCTVAKKIRRSPGGHSRCGEKIAGAILGARSWRSVVRSYAQKALAVTSQYYPTQRGIPDRRRQTDRRKSVRSGIACG